MIPEKQGISSMTEEEAGPYIPQFAKLDFPRYDRKDDLLGWLNRCTHFAINKLQRRTKSD